MMMQRHQDEKVNLNEVKEHIVKKIGVERSRKYFYYLSRFLNQKINKTEFDKSCVRLLGRENLSLHNQLIRSILRNATVGKSPPCGSNGVLPKSPRKVRLNGKVQHLLDKPISSRDDNRLNPNLAMSPLVAPLGIQFGGSLRTVSVSRTRGGLMSCYDSCGLPEVEMLRKRMESIATAQGLGGVSGECANTLNKMLDLYMKKLMKSCIDVVGEDRRSVSMLDFRTAMELNPQQLGEDWPILRERISVRSFEEQDFEV